MGRRDIRSARRQREAERLAALAGPDLDPDDIDREEAPAEAPPATPPPAADLGELQE